ncbi:MAG: GPP34 family phosphoprotein [Alphaproteobacteria bacterium]|nr:GPP34 family phosphoprotein [Alphaproteobacteria bacterium]
MGGLGLHHEYLLFALHDVTGKSLVGGFYATYALAGALVAEMQVTERLVAVKANTFALRPGPRSPGALGMAEERLEGRQLTMKKCIGAVSHRFLSGIGYIRAAALEELASKGIVSPVQDRFLFVPWRMRYPEVDGQAEEAIRNRLREHIRVVGDGDAPGRDDLFLSLLRVSKLLGNVWTDAELERLKPALEERTKRAPIGKLVKELVRDAEAAAAAAGAAYTCPAAFRDFEDE